MSKEFGRTARHRSLGRELEKLRKAAGLTQDQAARTLGWGRTKLVRIESTESMPALPDISQILGAYGGDRQDVRLEILDLTRHVRDRGWWVAYDGLIDGSYAELEDDADRILSFQTQLLPGLIQEAAYALELIRDFTDDPAEQKRRLDVRMMRRAVLDREKPPFLDIVLTEEVLDRQVGGPDVMKAQLQALADLYDRPHISVRMVGKDLGRYPSMGQGSIVIFEFDSPIDLDTGYVETFAGGYYVEDPLKVKACRKGFDLVEEAALSREETRALITKKIKMI